MKEFSNNRSYCYSFIFNIEFYKHLVAIADASIAANYFLKDIVSLANIQLINLEERKEKI